MLQGVLEERFKLKWHREKKQLPVYYVSAAKGGLKLPATVTGTCVPFDPQQPPPAPRPNKPPPCNLFMQPQTPDGLGMGIDVTGTRMPGFLGTLSNLVGRPIIDNTGFTGSFDVHLRFARDGALAFGGLPDALDVPVPSGLPNIFTAIRSLGLKIESGKSPVDVFVIDSIERPSPN